MCTCPPGNICLAKSVHQLWGGRNALKGYIGSHQTRVVLRVNQPFEREVRLNMTRILRFLNQLVLGALALCLSAGLGRAQDAYKGTFTLPFEAHWAGAVLPAGDYTISMPSTATPYLLFVRGEGKSVIILANGASEKSLSDDSKLTVVKLAGTETITGLEAGQIGLALDYPLPKSKTKPMASSTEEAKRMTSTLIPVRGFYGFASGR